MSFDPYEILNNIRGVGKETPLIQAQTTSKKNQSHQRVQSLLSRVGNSEESKFPGKSNKQNLLNEHGEMEQTAHFQSQKPSSKLGAFKENLPYFKEMAENMEADRSARKYPVYQAHESNSDEKQLIEELLRKISSLENKVYNLELELTHANEKIREISIEKHELEEQIVLLQSLKRDSAPANHSNKVKGEAFEQPDMHQNSFNENTEKEYFSFNHSNFSNENNPYYIPGTEKTDHHLGKKNNAAMAMENNMVQMKDELRGLISNIASKQIGKLRIPNIVPIFEQYPTLAKPIVHLKLTLRDLE